MKISWFQLIKAVPDVKNAAGCMVSKDWYKSQTIIYNLIKTGATVATACGIAFGVSDEEMQTIGTALAVAIPATLTVFDCLANVWLRFRTCQPLKTDSKLIGDKQN